MALRSGKCNHIESVDVILSPKAYECEECIKTGSRWVHLRTCQSCGVTLCCDSSPNKHATQHFLESRHPVVASAEPGERWFWCYEDEAFISY